MEQRSIFDLLRKDAPESTRAVLWSIHHRRPYEAAVAAFVALYGAPPVFRLKLMTQRLDIFLMHPRNTVAVDTRTGLLACGEAINRLVWDESVGSWPTELHKFISPQVVAVMEGKKDRREWTPEIEQIFHFREGRRNASIDLLLEMELAYSFEKGGFEGYFQVFAAPDRIEAFVVAAANADILALMK